MNTGHPVRDVSAPPMMPSVNYSPKTLNNGMKVLVATPRIGDDEREWAARRLDEMWARGFLSQAEHTERHIAAFAAVTRGELNETLAGLPDDPEEWRLVRQVPAAKKPDIIQSAPKAQQASFLMLLFVLVTLIFGIATLAVPSGPVVSNLAGAGLVIVAVVTLIREAAKP
jgi:Domain of unknown function (DUF1707)